MEDRLEVVTENSVLQAAGERLEGASLARTRMKARQDESRKRDVLRSSVSVSPASLRSPRVGSGPVSTLNRRSSSL